MRARPSDPETSHQAAASISDGRMAQLRMAIYHALLEAGLFGLTQEDLVAQLGGLGSPSSIRTRCAELAHQGVINDSGMTRRTASGRKAVVWTAV